MYYTVDVNTDSGVLLREFNELDKPQRDRILGYVEAICAMNKE